MIKTKPIRYDGIAEWYAQQIPDSRDRHDTIVRLLGPGEGLCLDLGCGPGQDLAAIAGTGRRPVGLELSGDQLRIARQSGSAVLRQAQDTMSSGPSAGSGPSTGSGHEWLVQGDAECLPYADGVFPTVVALWVSTDIDDFASTVREVARVLQPGGRFVFYGVHPCFNGPCVENSDDGARIVHPTYREAKRHVDSPWWGRDGIRRRVGGMRHLPLAELLTVIIDADLHLSAVEEPGDDPIPHALVLVADKPA